MFRRKLRALDYTNPDTFCIDDDKQFRGMISWLEDQKIRQLKINDRAALRNILSTEWDNDFQKYLEHVECPYTYTPNGDKKALLDWILGFAVRLEYADNADKYKEQSSDGIKRAKLDSQATSATAASNPLDNLNFYDDDFKKGVQGLQKLLNISPHPDHLVVLSAVSKIVQEYLSNAAISAAVEAQKQAGDKAKVEPYRIESFPLGFDMGDPVLNNAARVLRLLHVQELRDLQTKINETIVAVQAITADPKTDEKLGLVGR